MIDEEYIIGFDALYESMLKCKDGVLWKDSVAAFYHRGVERVIELEKELKDGTYKSRPTKRFKITYPKPRDIASVSFRDRVYQRSLNDNAVYPIMTRSFIYDNFACQKGKGTDPARNRLKEHLRRYYRKHGSDGWVAQFDIKGYYPNMDHGIAEEMFERKLPPNIFERVKTILREQYEGDKGYNPGSQLVQIAGISFLDGLDHYIKEGLHIKQYIRYMDDFILIHEDKGYLEECKIKIVEYLKNLKCEINEKKTRIYPLSKGIPFLGFIFTLSKTGKAYMHIKPENIKAERKRLRRMVNKALRGEATRESIDMSYQTWRSYAEKGDNYKALKRMDTYYSSLWEENNNGTNRETENEFKGKGNA